MINDAIHIYSCTDNKYIQHLGVLVTSIFENKKCQNNIIYHIFHSNIDDSLQKELKMVFNNYNAEVEFYDLSAVNQYTSVVRYGHVTKAALYRLSVGEVLPKNIDKVLYLDCDIVINDDLLSLWSTNIEEYQVAAVEDAPFFKRHEELFMPSSTRYFNSGVLLINLKKWRESNISQKILDFLVKFPERRLYNDQDGLNAILHSQWKRLPPIFNQQGALFYFSHKRLVYTKYEYLEARKHPIVIHYTGVLINTKPWHYIDTHPYKWLYYKYLKLTPWKGYRDSPQNLKDCFRKLYYFLMRLKMRSGIVLSTLLKTKD